jgi:hypothetical protein
MMKKNNNNNTNNNNNNANSKKLKVNWKNIAKKAEDRKIARNIDKQFKRLDSFIKPKASLLDYAHSLYHKDAKPARFPLLSNFRTHLKIVRYRTVKTVNASGNLIFVLKPAVVPFFANTSTASPMLFTNNVNYDPNSDTNNLVGANNWDTNYVTSSGLDLPVGDFVAGSTIATTICATITGVSNLNKQGKVYVAESANNYLDAGLNTDIAFANAIVNRSSLADLIKIKSCKEMEIMNMDSNSEIEYHYIPESGYSKTYRATPIGVTADQQTLKDTDFAEFVLVVSGAAANTQLQVNIYQVLQMRPATDKLDNYPSDYTECHDNPDPLLAKLFTDDEHKITIDKRHNRTTGPTLQKTVNQYVNNVPEGNRYPGIIVTDH